MRRDGALAASVEFRRVSKRYGPVVAVDAISFTIAPGTLVTLLGPSGCGKTTTLRLIAGLEQASEGQILIGGRDVTGLPATDRDVSMVFQSYALFPHMTVLENCAYGLLASRWPRRRAEAAAREKLALVGLAGYDKRLPSELSGGQQQRVAVARALVLEPQVLLFDEPLSNLDAKLRRRVRDEIRELQQSLGLTVVYVTHDQQEALAVSDRIIVMNAGTIAQEGAPRDLYEGPASLFVADFIGEANLVTGELRRVDERIGSVRLASLELMLPHRGLRDGAVRVAIRPEALHIDPRRAGNGAGLTGEITKSVYLGDRAEYVARTAIGDLFIIAFGVPAPVAPGTSVSILPAEHGITVVPD